MRHSACIEMLYQEVSFPERIRKASEDGFSAIEFWVWQGKDIKGIKRQVKKYNLEVGVFQGDIQGTMVDPDDKDKYVEGVKKSIGVAQNLGCSRLFIMTDILGEDRTVEPLRKKISQEQKRTSVLNVLRELAPIAEENNITLLIEPLNTLVDHKGYFLPHSRDAFEIVDEVDSENIKVLYDVYHMQIMEGNIIQTLRDNIDKIGHIHIADVPGRNEPGTGEVNYVNIYRTLKKLNYQGLIGFEFIPTGFTEESIKKLKKIFEF